MSKQTIYDQLASIHQQVRVFVEKAYPGYEVATISNVSAAEYLKPVNGAERVQGRSIARFGVECVSVDNVKTLSCDVIVIVNGEMLIENVIPGKIR